MYLDQSRLNIEVRTRTSRLPWRGQFSPELIEYFMDAVCPESRSFADPFCGSGTVLFEASEKGHTSYGVEVNPAAWHLASLAEFASLSVASRKSLQLFVQSLLLEISDGPPSLFSEASLPEEYFQKVFDQSLSDPQVKALAAAIILGMGNNKQLTFDNLKKGLFLISSIINSMKESHGPVHSLELSPFGGHFFHGVERVSTCESGLQFIAI